MIRLLLALIVSSAIARDDGHYASENPALHQWFDSLANQNHGLCCSFL
jgi:hypothetical protein